MARRKTKKRTHRRRRGMSGIAGGEGGVLMGVIGGVVVAKLLTKVTSGITALSNPYIGAALPIGVGLFIPKFVKSNVGKGLQYGMIATGGAALLTATGLMSGTEPMYHVKMVSGTANLKALSGNANLSPTSGTHNGDFVKPVVIKRNFTSVNGFLEDDEEEDYVSGAVASQMKRARARAV